MGYDNVKLAVYCTAHDLNGIKDMEDLQSKFEFMERHLGVDKVYLETFRAGEKVDPKKMLEIKRFFRDKGIKTSAGITTAPAKIDAAGKAGFHTFCYTSEDHRAELKSMVEITARLFDEIILDDFHFTNCRCQGCIKEKGKRAWSQFRTEIKKYISEELVLKTAKEVNPCVNMIIKYPNWYDHYQETGYNLKDESQLFDVTYTGTETRNPKHAPQHLQRYLSYFVMRYLENVKQGKNGGGWFDPYECTYNMSSYAEQAYLTLFGKGKEVTLFCLGSLLKDPYSIFVPMAGHIFSTLDKYLGQLGNPIGVSCYIPYHSSGEDFLHNYIGMLGIPLEPYPHYPQEARSIFLTASAAEDEHILQKIQGSLMSGANVMVTSGLVEALQERGFHDLANIRCSRRKAEVNRFGISKNNGVTFNHGGVAEKAFVIPQMEFYTNDSWQIVSAMGEENNFPILLQTSYGNENLYVLTIPDDFGNLYHYPKEILKPIRDIFLQNLAPVMDAVGRVAIFPYDNDIFIVESFLPGFEDICITVQKPEARLWDVMEDCEIEGYEEDGKRSFRINLTPTTYRIFKLI